MTNETLILIDAIETYRQVERGKVNRGENGILYRYDIVESFPACDYLIRMFKDAAKSEGFAGNKQFNCGKIYSFFLREFNNEVQIYLSKLVLIKS